MRIAYFDCFSGISGDMTLGALIDAGLDLKVLERELKKLKLTGYGLKAAKVKRGQLAGTKFDCLVKDLKHSHRSLNAIIELIDKSSVNKRVKDIAKEIFLTIGRAEAKVHGLSRKDEVEFHELGDIDSIIDIMGLAIAIDSLGIDQVHASTVNLGRMFAKSQHGTIPIPGPATLEILKDVPVRITDIEAELVTPTGAGILKVLTKDFGEMPQMKISSVGYGAGSRDPAGAPNMLRVMIGESKEAFKEDRISVIETNIDDMSPQGFEYLFERLFNEGALDVYTTVIQMKKSRPAFKLTVLSKGADLERLSSIIFKETTTIGLRYYEANRFKLERRSVKANTKYGDVKVKVSEGPDNIFTASPEYDECVKLARAKKVPFKTVYDEAKRAVKVGVLILFLLAPSSRLLTNATADTIIKKDGQELKGIVVEDYRDRVTFSTVDGEISVFKAEMQELDFDTEEDNLIRLAQQAQERGDFQKSHSYYNMALKANPLSKMARDGLAFLQGYLFRKDEVKKEEAVKRQQELELYGPFIPEQKKEEDLFRENMARLKGSLGIVLDMKDSSPEVVSVTAPSPATDAGIKKGDLVVAVWGKLTGYIQLKEVVKMLLDKPALEVKCTIERSGPVAVERSGTGASFTMEFDGLTVSAVKDDTPAFRAGLNKNDLIVAINGQSTRYMPLKKALALVGAARNKSVKLTFRREVTIWRTGGTI